jgi:superfamily II DNA or RNA helicase
MRRFSKRFKTFKQDIRGKGKKSHVVTVEEYNYVGGNPLHNEYIFHITVLSEFLVYLNKRGIKSTDVEIHRVPNSNGTNITLGVNKKFTLRPYQKKYVTYINGAKTDHKRTLIDLQTGKGKSLIATAAAAKLSKRILLIVLPKYMDKWELDIQKYTDIHPDEFKTIQGSEDLKKFLNNEFDHKVIIISTRTLLFYYNAYENDPVFDYPVKPTDVSSATGIQTLLIDEVHQEFYVVAKSIMYLNMRRVIGMSATLIPTNQKEEYLYKVVFPEDSKLSLLDLDRYVNVTAVEYEQVNGRHIRTYTRIEFGYQHTMFEKQMMKKSRKLQEFFNIIYKQAEIYYINKREKGDKLLIFFSTVKMITKFMFYIKRKQPALDIRKYTSEDTLDDILTADVTITTPGSAGTALDIPDLTTVINTVSIGSEKLNIQMLGRLRDIPGKELNYVYLWSRDIRSQQSHHLKRKRIMIARAKNFKEIKTNMSVW